MGGSDDPTIAFLRTLKDEKRWAVRKNVPIFVPHKRGEVEVTAADLPRIVAEMKALERNAGVVGRVSDRHTIEPNPNGEGMRPVYPPPVVYGFQVNPRVGTFGPKNTPCILVDWHLYPEHAAKCDRMPYRSVEYQHTRKLIRGVAVLVNDPYLDMGMVAFENAERLYLYSYGGDMNDDDKKKPDATANEAPAWTPEEEKMFEKCRMYMCKKYGMDESWPAAKKEEATEQGKEATAEPPAKKEETAAMQQVNNQIAAYQTELAATKARVAGLEAERDLERCAALMSQLANYSLSDAERTKELTKLQKLPHAERADRIEELKAIYAAREVPTGTLAVYSGAAEPGSKQVTEGAAAAPWYFEPAMQYMREQTGRGISCTYDMAVSHVREKAGK